MLIYLYRNHYCLTNIVVQGLGFSLFSIRALCNVLVCLSFFECLVDQCSQRDRSVSAIERGILHNVYSFDGAICTLYRWGPRQSWPVSILRLAVTLILLCEFVLSLQKDISIRLLKFEIEVCSPFFLYNIMFIYNINSNSSVC